MHKRGTGHFDPHTEGQIMVIHLGMERSKVDEAAASGVKSVPALVLPNGNVLHINFGASIEELR